MKSLPVHTGRLPQGVNRHDPSEASLYMSNMYVLPTKLSRMSLLSFNRCICLQSKYDFTTCETHRWSFALMMKISIRFHPRHIWMGFLGMDLIWNCWLEYLQSVRLSIATTTNAVHLRNRNTQLVVTLMLNDRRSWAHVVVFFWGMDQKWNSWLDISSVKMTINSNNS